MNSTHASGESCAEHSLFGLLTSLNANIQTPSFIIVVVSVLAVERFFHNLHKLTHDTPFNGMVLKIEKELMIVGFMAFVLKVILSLTKIEENWLLSLEFADLVIPIISFCFCFQGIFLILFSVRQLSIWSKACHLKPVELCHDYYQIDERWVSRNFLSKIVHFVPSYISWYRVTIEMEFRVFLSIFSDNFMIHEGSLELDEYVDLLYERFVSDLVSIEMEDWLIIIGIALIILLRKDTDSSGCAKGDSHCQDRIGVYSFFAVGVGLFVALGIMAIVGRYYMLQLLATKGVKRHSDLPIFLSKSETADENNATENKLSLSEIKELLGSRKLEILQASTEENLRALEWNRMWRRGNTIEIMAALKERAISFFRFKSDERVASIDENQERKDHEVFSVVRLSKINKSMHTGIRRVNSIRGHMLEQKKSTHSQVFLFGSLDLYVIALKRVNICIAAYNGFLLANFISASKHMNVLWQVIIFLPGLFSFIFFAWSLRSAIIFMLVGELDEDVLESVLENSEASANLRQSVRDKLIARLSVDGDPEAALRELFEDLDDDGSDSLGRSELMVLMKHLGINFSRKRWKAIFKAIDRNADDQISLHEFFLFLLPNHDEATLKEQQRLKLVKDRVNMFCNMKSGSVIGGVINKTGKVSAVGADAVDEEVGEVYTNSNPVATVDTERVRASNGL